MKITVIEARDLPEAWFLCLRKVLLEGREYKIDSGSYVGQFRKELDFVVVQVRKPDVRPLVPDTPTGVPAPASMSQVDDYMDYLMTGVKMPNEIYTYGEDLSSQIPEAIRIYREDGLNTNRVCMSVGSKDSIKLEHSQCLRCVDTRIQDNALHFFVYFRSWDLMAGFPVNLAALQLLKDYMAAEIGVYDGELVATSKGLHLYDHSWKVARLAAGLEEPRKMEEDSGAD